MLYKNKYRIWKYTSSNNMEGGMMNDKDFKSALDSRPRFAHIDKLRKTKSYHIELDEDDDGNIKKRRVRTQSDLDHYNAVVNALRSLGIYK